MPIIEVELVTDEHPRAGLADTLADDIGVALGSEPGSTWVRLRTLSSDCYGESGGRIEANLRPVFVTITAHRRPEGQQLRQDVERVTTAVAADTGHRRENVHVIYAPDAAGRIAFGGTVRE